MESLLSSTVHRACHCRRKDAGSSVEAREARADVSAFFFQFLLPSRDHNDQLNIIQNDHLIDA